MQLLRQCSSCKNKNWDLCLNKVCQKIQSEPSAWRWHLVLRMVQVWQGKHGRDCDGLGGRQDKNMDMGKREPRVATHLRGPSARRCVRGHKQIRLKYPFKFTLKPQFFSLNFSPNSFDFTCGIELVGRHDQNLGHWIRQANKHNRRVAW